MRFATCHLRYLWTTACLVGLCPFIAQADLLWNEIGDAGDLPSTAQLPVGSGTLLSISGNINFIDDVDMFAIEISDPAAFSATTTWDTTDTNIDSQLFLFDADGYGVYFNDDIRTWDPDMDRGSNLPANHPLGPQTPGLYYLAVTAFDTDPLSEEGYIFPFGFPDIFEEVYGPTNDGGGAPVTHWDTGFGYETGHYEIQLTGMSHMPAPGAALLAVIGMPMIGWAKRRFV